MPGHTDVAVGSTALLTSADMIISEARADGDQVPPAGDSAVSRLRDEQSVLLWQACAYAEDLIVATESGRDLNPARDALLGFIHYELLPYLRFEEREFADWAQHGGRLNDRQVTDHDKIRVGASNVEISHNRRPLTVATRTLVDRLDRHIRSEQGWATEPVATNERRLDEPTRWVPPVLGDRVDLDALPIGDRDILVLDRLQRMRPGDVVRLRAGADLHWLWCRQHARSPGTHVWVYEQEGPNDWLVRVTRPDLAS